ncbi:MAG: uL15 family ribosomal protein [Candidatus Pacebacteria bacterium]|nr:uL15 family ribosomal protein [Candidatus Paceibacterota bacterium]
MQTHNLKRRFKNKKSTQVGRGGTRGKTSGRGTKGQNARAGRKKRPELRDIIKKIPKLRGRGRNSNLSIQNKPVVVNLDAIERHLKAGVVEVNPTTLVASGLVTFYKGKKPVVKILGTGELTRKIVVTSCAVSASAKAKIEKAGGGVK